MKNPILTICMIFVAVFAMAGIAFGADAGTTDVLGPIGAAIASAIVALVGYAARAFVKYINKKQDLIEFEYSERLEAQVDRYAIRAAAKAETIVENAIAPHAVLGVVTEAVAEAAALKFGKALSDIPIAASIEDEVRKILPIDATEKNIKKMALAATHVVEKARIDPREAIDRVHSILGGTGLGPLGKKR